MQRTLARAPAALQPRPIALRCAITPAQRGSVLQRAKCRSGRLPGARPCASAQPAEPTPPEPAATHLQPAPPAPLASAEDTPVVGGVRIHFQDVYYYINILYWTLLLASVLSGNPFLEQITHFENFVTAMCGVSAAFVAWFGWRWVLDVRRHLATAERRDGQLLLRYGFNAIFWLAFVLWYSVPTVDWVTDWTATAGAIMCLYGLALAVSSALMIGMWSFFGETVVPRRLTTGGPYALLRHPQSLGNLLFLVGFSMAGGAVAATGAFLAAFWIYRRTVIPQEEALLESAFGDKYRHYVERVPAFAWALILLLIVEAVLMWRYAPWSMPVGAAFAPRVV